MISYHNYLGKIVSEKLTISDFDKSPIFSQMAWPIFGIRSSRDWFFSQNDLRVKLFTTTAFVCSCIFQIIRPEI